MIKNSISRYFTIILCLFLLSCSNNEKEEPLLPAEDIYTKAMLLLKDNSYKSAAEEFSKIYFGHPGHKLAAQAELMEAYAYYLAGEYLDAIDVLDNIVRLRPRSKNLDYVYYLRSLCYYMQISGVELDQSKTLAAFDALNVVIEKFPNTKYATDAALKLDLVRDHLAGENMEIGRFYLKNRNPIAAIGRFDTVVQEYAETSHVEEALMRLVESYMMLGLRDEAQKYAAILGHNATNSVWYKRSYELLE